MTIKDFKRPTPLKKVKEIVNRVSPGKICKSTSYIIGDGSYGICPKCGKYNVECYWCSLPF